MRLDDEIDWEPPTADRLPYTKATSQASVPLRAMVMASVVAIGLVVGAAGAWVVLTLWDNAR